MYLMYVNASFYVKFLIWKATSNNSCQILHLWNKKYIEYMSEKFLWSIDNGSGCEKVYSM